MACALGLPALPGLLATTSASGLSCLSPEVFPLLTELVEEELLSLLIRGVKQSQKDKVSSKHQDTDGLQNELL